MGIGSPACAAGTAASSCVEHDVLRPGDDAVHGAVSLPWLAHEQGASHVAAVALDLGPEVEQQHRARHDRPIAW